MTKIRRYCYQDIDTLISLLEVFLKEERVNGYVNHHFGIDLDKEKVYNLLKGNEKNIKFFGNVVEDDDGNIVGACFATLNELMFSKELVADEKIIYLQPGYNDVTALITLIKSYITWAKNRNVSRIIIGNSTGFKQDKFGKLVEKLGFELFAVGYKLKD